METTTENGIKISSSDASAMIVAAPRGAMSLEMISTVDEALARLSALQKFVASVMHEGIDRDFGVIPGTQRKTLFKPGAEKLCEVYGLTASYEDLETVKDWDKGFFFFRKRCLLHRGDRLVGEASASCNSRESKYAGRWVGAAEVPAELDKAKLRFKHGSRWVFASELRDRNIATTGLATQERTSKRGLKYTVYRIDDSLYFVPNAEIYDCVNTLEKMASKRALVSATIAVTRSSDLFVPDLEDVHDNIKASSSGDVVDAVWDDDASAPAPPAAPPPAPPPSTRTAGDIIADLGSASTKKARVALAREAGALKLSQQDHANLAAAFKAWDEKHWPTPAPRAPPVVAGAAVVDAQGVATNDDPDKGP